MSNGANRWKFWSREPQGQVTQVKRTSGRYTPATPKNAKVSPAWWGPTFLILLVVGVLVILMNYLSVFGHPSGWGLLIGLVIIAGGFAMATRYR